MTIHSIQRSLILSGALLAWLGLAWNSALAAPPGGLPPGLQKKAERGKPLPPGWQKKLQVGAILDDDIYHHGVVIRPRDRDGYITIRVDNEIIRLVDATREIVEILSH